MICQARGSLLWNGASIADSMIDAHIQLTTSESPLESLEDALEYSGVSGVIAIQRKASGLENAACLDFAKASQGLVCGMVAWAPLNDEHLLKVQLDVNSREDLVVGYLTDLQDLDINDWLTDHDVTHGINLIAQHNMPLDVILSVEQMPDIIPFLDAHPNLHIVLDHCVETTPHTNGDWERLLREIGRRPHVFYRLSGLAMGSHSDSAYQLTESLKTRFNAALEGFGSERLLYGSNWPDNQTPYPVWLNTVDNLIAHLSEDERLAIYENNAKTIYNISM